MTIASEDGATLASKDFEAEFGGKYSVLRYAKGAVGCEEQYFGRKGRCRFCDQTDPKMFRQVAHLVPEALGNTWLFSNDECDTCNAIFSEYEANLVDAIRPILTIGGMAGKTNKVPQTGRSAGKSVIKHTVSEGRRGLAFMATAGEPDLAINPLTSTMTIGFPVPPIPFKPRLAYKALAKMAYALLPDAELVHFTKLRAWIRDKSDTVEFPCLETGLAFGSLGNAPKLVSAVLLQRVDQTDKTPYIIFVLCAGSVCLMIDLMSDDMEDHLDWAPMGCVNIKWSVELGPNSEVRIEYDRFRPMNWASVEKAPQPVEKFAFRFNPRTSEGSFEPIMRQQWR
ncbi:hypothetical protein FHS83_000877 [Rhizomicrobium palustre]|uniref:HNH endonuclease 5 domain-containing protein n=1 Tax=Rhizomicrobium palustre TaxID=189966 RepID=A0A846MWF6_9PROT|nr:HNH endonuclease [Rhizomicrobium palustre]NIK87559.1 hypothetical protein [Rhizomicrobium palustre]